MRSWKSRSEEIDVDDFAGVGVEDWGGGRKSEREEGEPGVDARKDRDRERGGRTGEEVDCEMIRVNIIGRCLYLGD